MNPFEYVRPSSVKAAVDALAKNKNAQLIAGGTNLLDLMKRGVMTPERLIDVSRLPLNKIEKTTNGIRVGAMALNSTVSEDKAVLQHQPLLALALKTGASVPLRNMATIGGNLLQRTRCPYFYDTSLPCNKREPGTGCAALRGYNRMHAIFGWNDQCIAVHPSDMCIALAALNATITVQGPKSERKIFFKDFHRLPGITPEKDTNLQPGEVITFVDIPDNNYKNIYYLKVRDRASYAFALVSVAAALELKNKLITNVGLAMGGVAHKPWRLSEAEAALIGKPATVENFEKAADIAMKEAKGFKHNSFKIKLGRNSIVEALRVAANTADCNINDATGDPSFYCKR
jgi:xanthine dehydrogenase YagS FAD-binding subunit